MLPQCIKYSLYQKRNYRPFSILSNLSEIFDNILYNYIALYFEKRFSRYLTGFWKVFNPQTYLAAMEFFKFQKFWKSWDQGSEYSGLITDLSKAIDCLPHDLIIENLHTAGFDMAPLRLMHSFIPDRYQTVKISNSYSPWSLIKYEVRQVSFFGPIPFNVFLCDMFFLTEIVDIVSYADDNIPCTIRKKLIWSWNKKK